jgi:hypothetical protein
MFEPMKDVERFKRFFVSNVLHTLVWENDADLAPECLYEKLTGHIVANSPATMNDVANA